MKTKLYSNDKFKEEKSFYFQLGGINNLVQIKSNGVGSCEIWSITDGVTIMYFGKVKVNGACLYTHIYEDESDVKAIAEKFATIKTTLQLKDKFTITNYDHDTMVKWFIIKSSFYITEE